MIEQGSKTILLTDSPGSGKTCVLLDLAKRIETSSKLWVSLFIKGDRFDGATSLKDLEKSGLPEDIVGQCACLAKYRRVVVILDSLDILSLNRQHGVLKLFLNLLDQLKSIDKVTIVAACRTFDLKYDPLLRGLSWEQGVNLQPLDFESVVSPFLQKWGITPRTVSSQLRELLQLPQNLRLYGELAKGKTALQPTSEYELCNSFIEEVVAKPLGNQALNALYTMASYCMEQRSNSYSKIAFKTDENIIRQLISKEVLQERKNSSNDLTFSHQTLADCLTVRANLAKNKTLTEFILSHPQFPFIRPAIRAFFFYLRTQQPEHFGRQVRQVSISSRCRISYQASYL